MRLRRYVVVAFIAFTALRVTPARAATPPTEAEAKQLRIVQAVSELLRPRIEQLPVLIPANHALGKIEERTVTLNRNAVVVEGQRFDGVVVVAPEAKPSFGWVFVAPTNLASWSILREKGEMKGFTDFLRRTRPQVPLAVAMKPEAGSTLIFQKLDSELWSANERYIIWFRFNDAVPAEFSIRAAFFARASLSNNALPSLLFPTPTK